MVDTVATMVRRAARRAVIVAVLVLVRVRRGRNAKKPWEIVSEAQQRGGRVVRRRVVARFPTKRQADHALPTVKILI